MRKKIISLAASVVLAVSLTGIVFGYGGDGTGGPCVSDSDHSFPAGYDLNPGGLSAVNGVNAWIDPNSNYFDNCGTDPSASSAWVAIQPPTQQGLGQSILQVGIVMCDTSSHSWCTGSSPRYFLAKGGCTALPAIQDLGVADWGNHQYKIYFTDPNWYVEIDGVQKATVSKFDINVFCWINGGRKAVWGGERHNRGDALGYNNSASNGLSFTYVAYRHAVSTSWFNPGGSGCTFDDPDNFKGKAWCYRSGGTMRVWTDYQ